MALGEGPDCWPLQQGTPECPCLGKQKADSPSQKGGNPLPENGVQNEESQEKGDEEAEAPAPEGDHLPTGSEKIAEARVGEAPQQTAEKGVEHKPPAAHVGAAGDEGDEGAQKADEASEKDAFPAVVGKKTPGFFQKLLSFQKGAGLQQAGPQAGPGPVTQQVADDGPEGGNGHDDDDGALAVGGKKAGEDDEDTAGDENSEQRDRFKKRDRPDQGIVQVAARQPVGGGLEPGFHSFQRKRGGPYSCQWMQATGQLSIASSIFSSGAPVGLCTPDLPSACISNTSGQMWVQTSQEMHSSLSTTGMRGMGVSFLYSENFALKYLKPK